MTKDQLRADNERLVAEVAALRELLTVIGGAELPRPAPGQYDIYAQQSGNRLMQVTQLTRGIWKYTGSPVFVNVVLTTSETLRDCTNGPLWYKASEGALPAPVITDSERDCNEVNPEGHWPCHRGGDHGVHRDANGDEWRTDIRVSVTA